MFFSFFLFLFLSVDRVQVALDFVFKFFSVIFVKLYERGIVLFIAICLNALLESSLVLGSNSLFKVLSSINLRYKTAHISAKIVACGSDWIMLGLELGILVRAKDIIEHVGDSLQSELYLLIFY